MLADEEYIEKYTPDPRETLAPQAEPTLDEKWEEYQHQVARANSPAMNGAPSDVGYAEHYAEDAGDEEKPDEIEKHGPSAAMHAGHWTDEDGKGHTGAKAEAKLFDFKRKFKTSGGTEFSFGVEAGGEAGLDVPDGEVSGELGGGKRAFTPDAPKPKAEAGAKVGFSFKNTRGDHKRGYKIGLFAGKSTEEEGEGLPVSFGMDSDGAHVGVKVPTPWGNVGAEYSTENPASDYASSLLSPLSMPLNIGMSMFGLGDYAPGSLIHDGVGWLGDKLFGGDDEPSPLQMASLRRQMQRKMDAGGEPAGDTGNTWETMKRRCVEDGRKHDQHSEETYAMFLKSGMSPEVAEMTAGMANPGWMQLRQLDRSSKTMYDAQVQAGTSPEAARMMAQQINPSWEPAAAAAKPAAATPVAEPIEPGAVCRADEGPFAHFAH